MHTSQPTEKSRFTKVLRTFALILALICSAAVPMQAQTHRGEKSLGIKGGYISQNASALAGLVFEYSFSRHVRIAPQIGVVFRNHDRDALTLDVDVHFPITLGGPRANFYPIVGLAFNSWTKHYEEVDSKDITTHSNNLGANAGMGFDIRCTDSLKLSLEGRYTLLQHYSNVQVVASIAYVF